MHCAAQMKLQQVLDADHSVSDNVRCKFAPSLVILKKMTTVFVGSSGRGKVFNANDQMISEEVLAFIC